MSRPFVMLAALLISGILVARFSELSLAWLIYGLVAFAAILFYWRTRTAAIAAIVLLLGAALYEARYRIASPADLRVIFNGQPELVTIRGRLAETPQVREVQAGRGEVAYTYTSIDATEMRRGKEDWQSATGRVATRLRGELSADFACGRTVEVTGVIASPASAAAPGLFDYRAYLHNTRVFFQLKCDSTNDWTLLSREEIPLTERFRMWASAQLQRGIPVRDEASEMIEAMTLGLRNSMSGDMSDVFMRTGTLHIVAISGLHVACIAYFLSIVIRAFGLPRSLEGIIIVGVVWFYTAATGLQSSACRAAVMATIFMLQWMVRRPPDLLNTVAASAMIILLVQPEQLFQASFQLSFSVVSVIALSATWIERSYPDATTLLRHKILRIDPLLPYELVPRWKKSAKWALGLIMGNCFVSLASWIGSMPLTAYYFNTVTPVSLAANLVAVPLSSFSLGATVVSLLLPWLAPLTNYSAWISMKWTIAVVEFFAAVPLGYFYVPQPNGLFLAAYAAGVLILFVPRLRTGLRKYASAGVVALLSLLWLGFVYTAKPLAKITVLPCAGTPTFVEEPWWKETLIDCSTARDSDFMLKRFLRAQGRGSIDRLVITHGDAQVVGGFDLIWSEFSPARVYTSQVKMRSPGYKRTVELLTKNPFRWNTIGTGDAVDGWTILHPQKQERGFPRADDNAIVLRRKIGNWTIVHLSDLGTTGQKQLLESAIELKADIVIAGIPEQSEPLSEALLNSIQPRVIVLGTAEYPYTARGTPQVRSRLEASGATVFYTDQEQAVTIQISRRECIVTTMKGNRLVLQ